MKHFASFMGMCEFMTAFFSLTFCIISISVHYTISRPFYVGDFVGVSCMMVMLMVFISLRVLITSYDDKENHEESTQVD